MFIVAKYKIKNTGIFPTLVHGLENHLSVSNLILETFALLLMIDDSLKVLISLLHLIHHFFELVRSGTNCIWVTLTALIKVMHFLCSETIDIYLCKFNKDQNDVRVIYKLFLLST